MLCFYLFSHLQQESSEAGLNQLRMVVTHMVFELVTPGELLLAPRAPEGGLGYPVQGRAELAATLASVNHVLDLQQTIGHLSSS